MFDSTEHKINLIKVGDPKVLGQWAGLCKIDRDGKPRKGSQTFKLFYTSSPFITVVGCSCVVVKDFGVESEALSVLLDYL